jgi:uncharacterized protein (DUF302 family)
LGALDVTCEAESRLTVTDTLGFTAQLNVGFDQALARTKDALKAEGFGIISEIDMQAAFKEKLGLDFRRFVILGACNPALAHKAISADPEVGLLLPCNVTVEAASEATSIVRIVDPVRLLGATTMAEVPEFEAIAKDAHARLTRVAEVLRA